MRLGRASLALAFLAVIALGVAGTASSAGTQPVTATTITLQSATCSPPIKKGNVEMTSCSGGVEEWVGDITGIGTYSYDRIKNLTTNVRTVRNGVETITGGCFLGTCAEACVLDTCGGTLYSRWNENDLKSGALKLEQSFQGGTGAFTHAHGSMRVTDPDTFTFTGRVGI